MLRRGVLRRALLRCVLLLVIPAIPLLRRGRTLALLIRVSLLWRTWLRRTGALAAILLRRTRLELLLVRPLLPRRILILLAVALPLIGLSLAGLTLVVLASIVLTPVVLARIRLVLPRRLGLLILLLRLLLRLARRLILIATLRLRRSLTLPLHGRRISLPLHRPLLLWRRRIHLTRLLTLLLLWWSRLLLL